MNSINFIYNALVAQLEILNKEYVDGNNTPSDAFFDSILSTARTLEKQYPELDHPQSITKQIRKEVIHNPIRHLKPMLSLDNAFTINDIQSFHDRNKQLNGTVKYLLEDKLDGVALAIIYRDKMILDGSTRGDGIVGESIGGNILYIKNVPHTIDFLVRDVPDLFEVRGEVVMTTVDFQKLKELGYDYANKRNAVAGIIRSRHIDKSLLTYLTFVAYDAYPAICNTQDDLLYKLSSMGFRSSQIICVTSNIDKLQMAYQGALDDRHELDYDIDGIVIKVRCFEDRDAVGSTSMYPLWAIAYKFPAMEGLAIIEEVSCEVGRSGIITPVAYFKYPVALGGVSVTRATLHNYNEVARLGLGILDTVVVKRAGDVIPKITECHIRCVPHNPILPPTHCPSCNELTQSRDGFIYCGNVLCDDKQLAYLLNFVSTDALDIMGLGGDVLLRLLKAGIVIGLADIMSLTKELLKSVGVGDKTASNILESIAKSKTTTLSRFIVGLGIPLVGPYTAKLLSRYYTDSDLFLSALPRNLPLTIKGIGQSTVDSLIKFYNDVNRHADAVELAKQLRILPDDKLENGFAGKRIVITGSFEHYARSTLSLLLTQKGFAVYGSVNQYTNYLLVGKDPSGSKLKQFKKCHDCKIITSTDLIKMGVIDDGR